MFLNDAQQLQRHTAGVFCPRFPLLDRGSAGVQVTCKHRLTDIVTFAQRFDLICRDCGRYRGETRLVEFTHGRLADCTDGVEGTG
ncbi:hypothetical protein D9M71_759800 [compost metagenome]